eukprot:m.495587 g.495587  ORF g.495587 m.495587 type:complete len:1542 (+) comp21801_c0_seq10:612-5237(+)
MATAASMAVEGNGLVMGGLDEESTDAWSHLLKEESEEPFWDISDAEKDFYIKLSDLPDEIKLRRRQAKGSKILIPIDLYSIREFVRSHGSRERFNSPGQGLKTYLARSESDRVLCEAVWKSTRNYTKYKSPLKGVTWLKDLYRTSIEPFERRWKFASLNGEQGVVEFQRDPQFEDVSRINSMSDADSEIQDILGSISAILQAESPDDQLVRQLLNTIYTTRDIHECAHVKKRRIVLLGDTRVGKSFLINSLLATSEQVPHLYNLNNSECTGTDSSSNSSSTAISPNVASDAAAVVANLMVARAQAHSETIDDTQGPSISTFDSDRWMNLHEVLVEKISDLRTDPVLTEVDCIFHCELQRVVWKLPSLGPDGTKPHFDNDGTLKLEHCPAELRGLYKTATESARPFIDHLERDMIRQGNIKGKIGEFFLPSNDSHSAVTTFNTNIWGGSQYAFVVTYMSYRKVQTLVRAAFEHDCITEVGIVKRKHALQLLYGFVYGISGATDESSLQEMQEHRHDYVDVMAAKSHLPKFEPRHPSTAEYDGKFHVYQGQGKSVVHDRVYIQWKLLQVLNDPIISAFIDEIHVLVPSVLLDSNMALVDAPGVNDPDIVKFARLSDGTSNADGVVVCLNKHLGSSQSTLKAMEDLTIVRNLALDVAKHRTAPNKPLVLSLCSEERSPRHGLPREKPQSVLHETVQGELKDFVDNAGKTLLNAVIDHCKRNETDLGLPAGRLSKTPELDQLRSFRTEIRGALKASIAKSCFHPYPTLYRGCMEAIGHGTPVGDVEAYVQQPKGMQALINAIHAVLIADQRVTSDRIGNIRDQLAEVVMLPREKKVNALDETVLHRTVEKLQEYNKRHGVAFAAAIEEKTSTKVKAITWEHNSSVRENIKAWVKESTVKILTEIEKNADSVFFKWNSASSETTRVHAASCILDMIQQAKERVAFDTKNILSGTMWQTLRGIISAGAIWESTMAQPFRALLKSIKEVFAVSITKDMQHAAAHYKLAAVPELGNIVEYFVEKVLQPRTTSKRFADKYVADKDSWKDDLDLFLTAHPETQMKNLLCDIFWNIFHGLDTDRVSGANFAAFMEKKVAPRFKGEWLKAHCKEHIQKCLTEVARGCLEHAEAGKKFSLQLWFCTKDFITNREKELTRVVKGPLRHRCRRNKICDIYRKVLTEMKMTTPHRSQQESTSQLVVQFSRLHHVYEYLLANETRFPQRMLEARRLSGSSLPQRLQVSDRGTSLYVHKLGRSVSALDGADERTLSIDLSYHAMGAASTIPRTLDQEILKMLPMDKIEGMVQDKVTPRPPQKGYEEKHMRLFSVLAQALDSPEDSGYRNGVLLYQLYKFNLEDGEDTAINAVKFFCNVYKTDVVVVFCWPSRPPQQIIFKSAVKNPLQICRVHVLFDTTRGVPWLLQPAGTRSARAATPTTFSEAVDVGHYSMDVDEAQDKQAHYREVEAKAHENARERASKSTHHKNSAPRPRQKQSAAAASATSPSRPPFVRTKRTSSEASSARGTTADKRRRTSHPGKSETRGPSSASGAKASGAK